MNHLSPLAQTLERMLNQAAAAAAGDTNPSTPALPREITAQILAHLGLSLDPPLHTSKPPPQQTKSLNKPHPASTPPRNGTCPLMKLPQELRRQIFADSLPVKEVVVQPTCGAHAKQKQHQHHHHQQQQQKQQQQQQPNKSSKPRRNPTSDLLTLSRPLCAEISRVVYEERCFGIHVHEGMQQGGVEFLNVGRQPLQYQDRVEDPRFVRFRRGEAFGFDRLMKIHLTVFPASEEGGGGRMREMGTYYMHLALVRLLERSEGPEGSRRITSLTVDFAAEAEPGVALEEEEEEGVGSQEGTAGGNYWWCPRRHQPRETSIHGTPNIELVLLPFSRLRCHNVRILLPLPLRFYPATVRFVEKLTETMTGTTCADLMDDQFLRLLEAGRERYEEQVLRTLHSNGKRLDVPASAAAEEWEEGGMGLGSPGGSEGDEELQRVLLGMFQAGSAAAGQDEKGGEGRNNEGVALAERCSNALGDRGIKRQRVGFAEEKMARRWEVFAFAASEGEEEEEERGVSRRGMGRSRREGGEVRSSGAPPAFEERRSGEDEQENYKLAVRLSLEEEEEEDDEARRADGVADADGLRSGSAARTEKNDQSKRAATSTQAESNTTGHRACIGTNSSGNNASGSEWRNALIGNDGGLDTFSRPRVKADGGGAPGDWSDRGPGRRVGEDGNAMWEAPGQASLVETGEGWGLEEGKAKGNWKGKGRLLYE